MKKLLISTIVAVCAFAMTANAQLFLAGSAGFSTNSKGAMPNSKAFGFSFSPEVGYFITDDISVGLALGYERTKTTDKDDNDTWTKSSAWKVAPFARYKFAELGDFSALIGCVFGFGNGKNAAKSNGVKTSSTGDMQFAFVINPVLAYSLSENFDIELDVNFLSLGFYHSAKESNQFKLGADTYGTSVSFIYKL